MVCETVVWSDRRPSDLFTLYFMRQQRAVGVLSWVKMKIKWTFMKKPRRGENVCHISQRSRNQEFIDRKPNGNLFTHFKTWNEFITDDSHFSTEETSGNCEKWRSHRVSRNTRRRRLMGFNFNDFLDSKAQFFCRLGGKLNNIKMYNKEIQIFMLDFSLPPLFALTTLQFFNIVIPNRSLT